MMSILTSTSTSTSYEPRVFSPSDLLGELQRRQPRLAAAAELFLLAVLPVAFAILLDDRQVNGINIWIKPAKFLVSLAIYYGSLAWFHGYLSDEQRRSKLGRALVGIPIAVGLLEMTWLLVTAALGVASHFNRTAPIYEVSYALAGLGATTLMVVVLIMGIRIARTKEPRLPEGFRLSLLLGSVLSFVATMVTAGYLAAGNGHWVGGTPTDAGGLPILGWSRTGGDLRVAHFFAMHALQVVPLLGGLVVTWGPKRPRAAVWVLATLYASFIAFTFVQALSGRPFL
jgi:hypothetical protein